MRTLATYQTVQLLLHRGPYHETFIQGRKGGSRRFGNPYTRVLWVWMSIKFLLFEPSFIAMFLFMTITIFGWFYTEIITMFLLLDMMVIYFGESGNKLLVTIRDVGLSHQLSDA